MSVINCFNIKFEGKLNFRCVGPLPVYSFYTLEIQKMLFKEIDWAKKKLGLNDFSTKDEIKNPYDLIKRAWINGLLATESSTKNMIHKIPEFINVASQILTLLPGTIISTGAPNTGRLKPGDLFECEITQIGKMKNPIIAEVSAV